MTKFIVIAGQKQVGKTTASVILTKLLRQNGKTVHQDFFARPIKEFCVNVLGIPRELVYGSNEQKNQETQYMWDNMSQEIREKYSTISTTIGSIGERDLRSGPMTVREVMQVFGTDIMRDMFDKNIWAYKPFRAKYINDYVILDDGRLLNEIEIAKRYKSYTIKIVRSTGFQDEHQSEQEINTVPRDMFNFDILNNCTMQNYEKKIAKIVPYLIEYSMPTETILL